MKYIVAVLVLLLCVAPLYAGQKTLSFGTSGDKVEAVATGTYANSQVDTVKIIVPAGTAALSFGAYYADSVQVVEGIVRRVVNGTLAAVRSGDTLSVISAASAIAGSQAATVYLDAITLAPETSELWVIVTYAGTVQGVTAPNVRYSAFRRKYN